MAKIIPLGTRLIMVARGEPNDETDDRGEMLIEGEGETIAGMEGGVASCPHSRSSCFGMRTGGVVGGTDDEL